MSEEFNAAAAWIASQSDLNLSNEVKLEVSPAARRKVVRSLIARVLALCTIQDHYYCFIEAYNSQARHV